MGMKKLIIYVRLATKLDNRKMIVLKLGCKWLYIPSKDPSIGNVVWGIVCWLAVEFWTFVSSFGDETPVFFKL
jgi:hypothetical protein